MSTVDKRLLSEFCRATLCYCILGDPAPDIARQETISTLLGKLREVLVTQRLAGARPHWCLRSLDYYELGRRLHVQHAALSALESLGYACSSLLDTHSHDYTVAHALVYGLASRVFTASQYGSRRFITFRDPKLENAEVYYWFTRWLPPDQIQAAAEVLYSACFSTPISKRRLTDHHVHLSAYHTSLVARLLYANPKHVRLLLIRAKGRQARVIAHAHIAALTALTAQVATYYACLGGGVVATPALAQVVQELGRAEAFVKRGDTARAAWRLRRVLRLLAGRHTARLNPLTPILGARDAHETEMRLHERCETKRWPGASRYVYAIYLAASTLLHTYITFNELYRSLELMSTAYQRAELGTARRLVRLSLHEGLNQYYSSIVPEPKVSGKYRNWRLARYAARALNKQFPILYISLIKRRRDCEPRRARTLCWAAVTRAYHSTRIMLSLQRNPLFTRVARSIGLDVAGEEKRVPNWPYVMHILYARSRAPNTPVSFHAGEDFYHTFNGIRKILEAVEYAHLGPGDRIGHGYALYAPPDTIREERETLLEALSDIALALLLASGRSGARTHSLESLAFRLCNAANLTGCNPYALAEAYETLHKPSDLLATLFNLNTSSPLIGHLQRITIPGTPASRQAALLLDQLLHNRRAIERLVTETVETRRVAEAVEGLVAELQEELRNQLRERGVAIESCPTSNHAVIGVNYKQHPLPEMIVDQETLAASDDPSLLAADIITEEKVAEALLSPRYRLSERLRKLREIF